MTNLIKIKDVCPICETEVTITDNTICHNCNWVFMYFSEPIDMGSEARINIKKSEFNNLNNIKEAVQVLEKKNKTNYSKICSIKKQQTEILTNLQEIRQKELNILNHIDYKFKPITLQKRIQEHKEYLKQLEKEDKPKIKPSLEIVARLEGKHVILQVIKGVSIKGTIVLAVGFAQHPIHSILEADIIIPTVKKEVVIYGQDTCTLDLISIPPLQYSHYFITHLYNYTLSNFILKNAL